MKNSGIEWIGNIPDDWSVSRYKFYTTNRMGETILASDTKETGIPVYSATQEGKVFGYVDKANVILKSGDIVIPARGNSIGCAKIVEDEIATCTQTTICSCDIRNCENKYLVYCCYGLKDYWFKYDGSAIPQITVKQVDNNYLPLPDLRVQNIIVKTLDQKCGKIDELIANQQGQIEKLKEYKQSVITEAVTKGLDKSAPLKDSGIEWIGEIPAHWEVKKIKYLFEESSDRNIDLSFELLTFSGSKGLIRFAEHTDKLPCAEDLSNYKVIHKGQLCMNRMQAWHGMFIHSNIEGCVSPDYAVYIPFKNTNVRYYSYVFRTPRFVQQFANLSKGIGTGFNRLYTPAFFQVEACYPSKKEQDFIVDYLDEKCGKIDRLIAIKQEKIEKLQEYKKSLIYEYVTGKKEVS